MQIRRIDTDDKNDVNQFIRFPFELYQGCEQWVPPFVADMALVMNRCKYPFYQHSDADFLVAEKDGRMLGRIAVLDNRKYNDYHKKSTAFFYFFDAVDDPTIAPALFDEACKWAKQRGLNHLIGPIGFMQGDGLGLLAEGFEHRPAIGIPYNYAYYHDLLRQAGLKKKTDYFSGYLPGDHELSPRFYQVAEKVKQQRNFRIKCFSSKRELRRWVPAIQKVYNQSFAENFEHIPVSEDEAKLIADRLLAIANPRLIKLVMKDDEIIGFLFAFVDISAAIQKTAGRIWPFGWITLTREFKRTKWVNFNGTGLIPGHRGVGANAVLYTEMAKTVKEFGFKHADIVQVDEQNFKSLGDMKAIGVRWYKRHRVYELEV